MDANGMPVGEKPKSEPEYGFVVVSQKVELEIDFPTQSLTGCCEITILPSNHTLKEITLDARQCSIYSGQVKVDGVAADFCYDDPMEALDIHERWLWGVQQATQQKQRLKPLSMTDDMRSQGSMVITLPQSVKITEVDPLSEIAVPMAAFRGPGLPGNRASSIALDTPASAISTHPKTSAGQFTNFKPLVVSVSFSVHSFREGLHWVGVNESDSRFSHLYTRHSIDRGIASCIFPCVDDSSMRCSWNISIKCSRTLGDALKRRPRASRKQHHSFTKDSPSDEFEVALSEDEKLLEMAVVCSGELTNETTDLEDSSKKIVSFHVEKLVAPQHIGFAIGPFEQVDLSDFREVEDDEKLGQGQAVPIWAYCLPGRSSQVRHVCAPLAHAVDHFSLTFGTYPFSDYRLVFVDDQINDTEHTASLTVCSNRLLFPETIIDPEVENVRTLVHAVASQWIGVGITPVQPHDRWITIGLSHYITGTFMKTLCGNNDYAFRQKTLSDKLVELDFQRPSIHALGEVLHLGSFEYEFMQLKAPLVMFILDRRLVKATGSTGLTRVINKIILQANTASENTLSTDSFRKLCEKITKYRQLDTFWKEWVLGSGCPRFHITQKFNKKRLCVELSISQKQDTMPTQRDLQKDSFLREIKEEVHSIYAPDVQPVFTGPMTIRIHEADGTPYEHIMEIREANQKIDIPYNTKYKRLKRSRKQKERLNAAGADPNAEGGEDSLLYCLGDVLQKEEEKEAWDLREWDADTEAKMDMESYEWIRVDADFEWLCERQFPGMASYMYVSQLQQDKDVVAQQESMLWLQTVPPHPLVSTFLTRTMMDTRYFHGIRTMAALALTTHASPAASFIGLKQLEKAYSELFCYPGSMTPQPNDFSDKRAYKVEMAIIKALSLIRDSNGNCPKKARKILLDVLRFNENSNNQFSDNFKITTLLSALAESLIPKREASNILDMGDDEEDPEPMEYRKAVVDELDRYRRNDEWIESYQNCFTVTVLDCKQRLMNAKIIPLNAMEFVQYLHDGNSEYVRIKAFASLIELGYLTNNNIACLLLNAASTDPSPHVRRHLFEVFCVGVAAIAFGHDKRPEPSNAKTNGEAAVNGEKDVVMSDSGVVLTGGSDNAEGEGDGGLIIEEDVTRDAEARAALIARTKTLDGALAALKVELRDNEVLKEALWEAVKSTVIGFVEQFDILDICQIIYSSVESLTIKLVYPRYWRVTYAGKGKLLFTQKEKIRTKPFRQLPPATLVVEPPKPSLPPPPPAPVMVPMPIPKPTPPKSSQSLKLTLNRTSTPTPAIPPTTKQATHSVESMAPPPPKSAPKRPAPEHTPSSDDRPRKRSKIVKIAMSGLGIQRVMQIQRQPPSPAPARARSTKSDSPGPKQSSWPSLGPKASPKPRHALPTGTSAPRTALPQTSSTNRTPLPQTSTNGRTPLPQKTHTAPAAPRTALPPAAPTQRHALPPSPVLSNTSQSISPPPPPPVHRTPTILKIRTPLPMKNSNTIAHSASPLPSKKRSRILKLKVPPGFLRRLAE
ncbi:hypothetical protein WAI453_011340 [Rhynchosporium graminicola]|uniref:Transcription initiation factor TFIID subunit 2 n=1 Tax=Rhynchosporium graminicola TaxID=2792576 RepID=A0A1E1KBC6_9HELO|nr:related to TSM1-component of TFIID complex [Rhynchosporium commune]